jgi:hypothetical protein
LLFRKEEWHGEVEYVHTHTNPQCDRGALIQSWNSVSISILIIMNWMLGVSLVIESSFNFTAFSLLWVAR